MRIAFLLLLLSTLLLAQDDTEVLRYPAISPDGSQISFSYQGDIWVAAADGSSAQRLTIHEAYEHSPAWSPDGETLVFSSNRYGNDDLFTIGANGKNLNRLTYHSASDYGARWKSTDEITFHTRRSFAQIERESEVYTIAATGGTPYRSFDALGLSADYNESGSLLAFVRGTCRTSREQYVGPANRDIWVYHEASDSYIEITDHQGQDTDPVWAGDDQLFYLSAENGRYNIHKVQIRPDGTKNGAPEALTSFTDEGIEAYDVAADGSAILFSYQSKLYTLDLTSGDYTEISLDLPEDYRFDPDEYLDLSRGATDFALSPSEDYIAFSVRGEVFVKENDEDKKLSVRPAPNSRNDHEVAWLNDSTLLFLSDRSGDYDLYQVRAKEAGDIYESFEWTVELVLDTDVEEDYIEISPDRSQIALVAVTGEMKVLPVDTLGQYGSAKTLMTGWSAPDDLTWSPDSKWIAYSQSDLDFNSEIFIWEVDGGGEPINVSMHPRSDRSPVWSPDGSKLGFLSIRNNGDADVWFAWLHEEDWQRTQSDWDELSDDDGEDEEADFYIDTEDIYMRLTQVTSLPGNEGDLLIGPDGEYFFFTTNGGSRQGSEGKSKYMKIKWNGEDSEEMLADGSIYGTHLDKSGKNIYYIKSGGTLSKIPTSGKKPTSLPYSAKMKVDYRAERAQVFDEAWRTLRDRFYDPQYHGYDWDALRDRYEDRALAASTRQDFTYVVNQMLGQLNSSHMGLRGSGDEETQRVSTGLLGVELKPHTQGVEITRVVPDSPADREQSKLAVGEVITAVNGMPLNGQNFFSMVNETVDERIKLKLISTTGERRDVVIRPTNSIRTALYEEWVADCKARVEEYSGGRLGYIHIRGMNWSSFERFERELMASGYGKDGVLIDVRYNGGGWTTDMVMAVLNVRQHAYTVPRGATDDLDRDHLQYKSHYPYGERLPLSAWTKPAIALCNENSYSNAEIFSHAFKTLGHGSLVGQPTFGAVISTGGKRLMDGFFVRVPFRAWYVKATEENMEHGPAVPDYIVDYAPDSRAKEEDAQLQKAVEVLLGQIDGE